MQELIGVAATYREDLSPHPTSTVGCRRDEVCQSLLELTLDLCDDHSVSIGACTLENLAALVQLFTGARFSVFSACVPKVY